MEEYKTIRVNEARNFIKDFIAFIRRSLLFIWNALARNAVLAIIVFLLVLAAGYFYQSKVPAYYQSEMVCVYNHLHKKTYGEMVQRLDLLVQSRSFDQVASILQLSPEEASSIVGFEAKNVVGSALYEDFSGERTPMYFTLKTKNRSIFPKVQEALVNYLNNTPYQLKRTAFEKLKATKKIDFLRASIQQIDSVIHGYNALLERSDSAKGFSNIAALFSYKDQLEDKLLENRKSLELSESVEVIYGFAPSDNPVKKGQISWARLLAMAFVLALGVSVVRQIMVHGR